MKLNIHLTYFDYYIPKLFLCVISVSFTTCHLSMTRIQPEVIAADVICVISGCQSGDTCVVITVATCQQCHVKSPTLFRTAKFSWAVIQHLCNFSTGVFRARASSEHWFKCQEIATVVLMNYFLSTNADRKVYLAGRDLGGALKENALK